MKPNQRKAIERGVIAAFALLSATTLSKRGRNTLPQAALSKLMKKLDERDVDGAVVVARQLEERVRGSPDGLTIALRPRTNRG